MFRISSKYEFQDVLDIFNTTDYILLSNEKEFKNCSSKIRYICPRHKDKGELTTTLAHLKEGKRCRYCGINRASEKRMMNELPVDEHKELCLKRGFEYVKSDRVKGKIGIYFICPFHRELGTQFMTVANMKRSENTKCIYCRGHNLPDWYIKQKLEKDFPNTEILSGYDGKLSTRMKVRCKKHNLIHSQSLQEIFAGRGCYYCGIEKLSQNSFLSLEEYQKRVDGHCDNIKVLEYNGFGNYGKYKCLKCGHVWSSNSQTFVMRNGKQCPNCEQYYSGERKVKTFLDANNISYIEQYKFPNCKVKRPLRFDFYLDKLNKCIEYDGQQHYIQRAGWTDLEQIQKYDEVKNKYCKDNNIELIRIPYWDYDNIDKILNKLIDK